MNDGDVERIQVNVRVDKGVKEAFDEKIIETFGTLRPYAGIELEREFRSYLDRGEVGHLRTVVEELLSTIEDTDCENKIREARRNNSVSIGYRISDKLRHEMKTASEEDYRSFGRLVEAIMYTYVTKGNFIQRMTGEIRRVLKNVEPVDDVVGAKDRRTQTIVANLENREQDAFDMADLEEAIEAASGIGASTYTKKEYLPRVLEELNFTWDPEHPGRFIDREEYNVPSIRDLTTKPYLLMDRDDQRKAIKIAAYRSSSQFFTIEDASAVLQGRPKRSTIKALMREIATSAPGYDYSPEDGKMKISSDNDVFDNPSQNLYAIANKHTAENWVDSAVESILQLHRNVSHSLRDFNDKIIDNKIGKAKYPGILTVDDEDRFPPEYVTRADREKFLQRLADELGKDSVDIYTGQ